MNKENSKRVFGVVEARKTSTEIKLCNTMLMKRMLRPLSQIDRHKLLFLQMDIMEKPRKYIYRYPSLLMVARTLMQASERLHIPLIMMEDNKKDAGETASEILEVKHNLVQSFEKHTFSAFGLHDFAQAFEKLAPSHVIMYGMQTHVCVLQTALDLLEKKCHLHLVVDGISSGRPSDRAVALYRLQAAGAIFTTAEALLRELVHDDPAEQDIVTDLLAHKFPLDDSLTEARASLAPPHPPWPSL